jgi:hypothetical protein
MQAPSGCRFNSRMKNAGDFRLHPSRKKSRTKTKILFAAKKHSKSL